MSWVEGMLNSKQHPYCHILFVTPGVLRGKKKMLFLVSSIASGFHVSCDKLYVLIYLLHSFP